ncbi:hypothetical protein A3D03_02750 [Candidatus Gottesmanbacteria bacterium RIFCSPHIGHO2_02_FULL_40_13]|uniref:DUF4181 domain-containing protein n=1 Tax=Candidatus Gottesmanbacteria bacterium RIFCSPHIGHO2_02_FULL_40_13 TaxID=1798384 RepID=A0A1F6A5B0_9BACT|nr:MAG: hypothetical protein A3D03_02750 [Candidatus Gottesmanbacteria bacterium RIFCSPHIGHO2_02_FULL_40_13]
MLNDFRNIYIFLIVMAIAIFIFEIGLLLNKISGKFSKTEFTDEEKNKLKIENFLYFLGLILFILTIRSNLAFAFIEFGLIVCLVSLVFINSTVGYIFQNYPIRGNFIRFRHALGTILGIILFIIGLWLFMVK